MSPALTKTKLPGGALRWRLGGGGAARGISSSAKSGRVLREPSYQLFACATGGSEVGGGVVRGQLSRCTVSAYPKADIVGAIFPAAPWESVAMAQPLADLTLKPRLASTLREDSVGTIRGFRQKKNFMAKAAQHSAGTPRSASQGCKPGASDTASTALAVSWRARWVPSPVLGNAVVGTLVVVVETLVRVVVVGGSDKRLHTNQAPS